MTEPISIPLVGRIDLLTLLGSISNIISATLIIKSINLVGKLRKSSIKVIIDLGATSNFISLEVVIRETIYLVRKDDSYRLKVVDSRDSIYNRGRIS